MKCCPKLLSAVIPCVQNELPLIANVSQDTSSYISLQQLLEVLITGLQYFYYEPSKNSNKTIIATIVFINF